MFKVERKLDQSSSIVANFIVPQPPSSFKTESFRVLEMARLSALLDGKLSPTDLRTLKVR